MIVTIRTYILLIGWMDCSLVSNCSVVGVQQLTTIFYTCILVDQVKFSRFRMVIPFL